MKNRKNQSSELFTPSGCLTAETLESLAQDTLMGEALEVANRHIAGCPLCHDSLDGLREWLHQNKRIKISCNIIDESIVTFSKKPKPHLSHPSRYSGKIDQLNQKIRAVTKLHHQNVQPVEKVKRQVLTYRWIAMAASILLLVGLFYIFTLTPKNEPSLALEKSAPAGETPPSITRMDESSIKQSTAQDAPIGKTVNKNAIVMNDMADEPKRESMVQDELIIEEEEAVAPVEYTPDTAKNEQLQVVRDSEGATIQSIEAQVSRLESGKKRDGMTGSTGREQNELFVDVEKTASFPGGEDALKKFILENLKYPESAREKGIQGDVIISFTVEPDGTLTDTRVEKKIGGGCDEEALNMVTKMPRWVPATQDGKAVRSRFSLPVRFRID